MRSSAPRPAPSWTTCSAGSARAATSCLARRAQRREEIARTGQLDFLPETREIRESAWTVPPPAPGLVDRRVEITGPTERKMAINALNSGAKVWLADLEDANTPHWTNVVDGQVNLYEAVRRTITFDSRDGKHYELSGGALPTIVMRPRGWHLPERHLEVDGQPAVGALVDAGLYLFHNAHELLAARDRAVPVPAEDGVAPGGPAVERRLRPRRGRARARPGHHPGHRAHRDHPGRVRDARDPVGAAAARRRPERRAVGLPVQHHQELPGRRATVRAARPGRRSR